MSFEARLKRAAQLARETGLAGVLAAPGPDLLYLTGYSPVVIAERITLLVVPADGEPAMIVPRFERSDAQAAPGAGGVAFADWADGSDQYAAAAALLEPGGRYAVSDATWAMHVLGLQDRLPDSTYISMSEALPMLRAIKDADELRLLAEAGAAADAAYRDICEVRFAGRAETDIAADLGERLLAHGHDTVEFAIVASGPNGANPHHDTGHRAIAEGDMVVLDFGGLIGGYSSDTTRTVHVGEPTAEEREVHELVVAAQRAGVEAVGPGVACQDVDAAARAVIADAGYAERFIHRTGHGIGLEAHEPPYIVEGSEQALEPGMTFSIEPGIYLPDRFGVRIEDIVAVTADGARRLNDSPHEIAIVA